MVTIRVYTAPGTNASEVGEVFASLGGEWRNSVDQCDSDGAGRVFIDCPDRETADYITTQMEDDDRVQLYSMEGE